MSRTPTKDQIREKATQLYMQDMLRIDGVIPTEPTEKTLKEYGYWDRAKRQLMYGAKRLKEHFEEEMIHAMIEDLAKRDYVVLTKEEFDKLVNEKKKDDNMVTIPRSEYWELLHNASILNQMARMFVRLRRRSTKVQLDRVRQYRGIVP